MDQHPLPNPEAPNALPAYPGNFSAFEHELMLPPQRLRRKRPGPRAFLRIALLVLIGMALFILFAMRIHTSDLEKATTSAEKFVSTMQSNQPDNAYAMGDEAFRKATTEQDLGEMFDRVEPFLDKSLLNLADTYYASSEKGDPRAIFVFTAAKGKQVTYIRLVMERQNKVWKAHSLLTQSTPLQAKPE